MLYNNLRTVLWFRHRFVCLSVQYRSWKCYPRVIRHDIFSSSSALKNSLNLPWFCLIISFTFILLNNILFLLFNAIFNHPTSYPCHLFFLILKFRSLPNLAWYNWPFLSSAFVLIRVVPFNLLSFVFSCRLCIFGHIPCYP